MSVFRFIDFNCFTHICVILEEEWTHHGFYSAIPEVHFLFSFQLLEISILLYWVTN